MNGKKYNKRNMTAVALQLIDYFNEKSLWSNVQIYVAGKRYTSEKLNADAIEKTTKNKTKYYCESDVDTNTYISHADPETINMTFEGPLYDLINYKDFDFIYNLTQKFISKYDLYFELYNTFTIVSYHV